MFYFSKLASLANLVKIKLTLQFQDLQYIFRVTENATVIFDACVKSDEATLYVGPY